MNTQTEEHKHEHPHESHTHEHHEHKDHKLEHHEHKEHPVEHHEHKAEHHTHEHKLEDKITEKPEEKAKEKKQVKEKKKDEALAKGVNLPLSKKHCMYICSFIKNKKVDSAIADLERVAKLKMIVPFKGEIPHRKGNGMMSGRYPVKAAKVFIKTLKSLKGNIISNGLDLDKTRITIAFASWAARPQRGGGKRAKRSYVIIKAKEIGGIK